MEQKKYNEDYCGDTKLEDMDRKEFIDKEDDNDDDTDKPSTKELIEQLGVDPDELFKNAE